MTNSAPQSSISIGMTTNAGAAGIVDIKFQQKITAAQARDFVEMAQTHILNRFQETRLIDLETIIAEFVAAYSGSQVSPDLNVAGLTQNELNNQFQQWFTGEDVDIAITIVDCNYDCPTVYLSTEGSSEQFVNMLQIYDLCE